MRQKTYTTPLNEAEYVYDSLKMKQKTYTTPLNEAENVYYSFK